MKRAILAGLLTLGLVLASVSAEAGHRHHYGHGGYKHHHKHRGSDNLLIAAGIVGGAVVLGSLLSYRPYSPPPPPRVIYVPAYRPTCTQDQVYRTLPDGRIQWGTRTRCY